MLFEGEAILDTTVKNTMQHSFWLSLDLVWFVCSCTSHIAYLSMQDSRIHDHCCSQNIVREECIMIELGVFQLFLSWKLLLADI